MNNDIQLGKDQIENYQNGDVDRPYKSKEKIRPKGKSFIDIMKHQKNQIEQLKAENEQMKLELDKYKSFINKCDPEKLGLFVIETAKSLNKESNK